MDETPWKTIASFAMYKLFAEWSEGNSARHTMPQAPQQFTSPQTQAQNFANPAIPGKGEKLFLNLLKLVQ